MYAKVESLNCFPIQIKELGTDGDDDCAPGVQMSWPSWEKERSDVAVVLILFIFLELQPFSTTGKAMTTTISERARKSDKKHWANCILQLFEVPRKAKKTEQRPLQIHTKDQD